MIYELTSTPPTVDNAYCLRIYSTKTYSITHWSSFHDETTIDTGYFSMNDKRIKIQSINKPAHKHITIKPSKSVEQSFFIDGRKIIDINESEYLNILNSIK